MKVTLVPSSFPSGGEEPCHYLNCYLINDTLAVDAGSIGVYGTPKQQAKIKHVLITHSHIDHTATLPIFIENAYEASSDCVTVHGSEEVLKALCDDIFNDRIWPDFVALSQGRAPFLKLERLESGRPVLLEGLKITPIPVNHVVPTFGFLIEGPTASVLISSDTGPTDLLWQYADATANLAAVFLEASFPNALLELATLTKHLTPALIALELKKLHRSVPIIAVHIKARFREQIHRELKALGHPDVQIGEFGKTYLW